MACQKRMNNWLHCPSWYDFGLTDCSISRKVSPITFAIVSWLQCALTFNVSWLKLKSLIWYYSMPYTHRQRASQTTCNSNGHHPTSKYRWPLGISLPLLNVSGFQREFRIKPNKAQDCNMSLTDLSILPKVSIVVRSWFKFLCFIQFPDSLKQCHTS